MKHTATMALMLTFGVASLYAQQRPVKMRFSGSGGPSLVNLGQPNSVNFEENVSGDGALGPFTYHDVRAAALPPLMNTNGCSLYLPPVFGGGIFRFQDGSLLTFKIRPNQGGDCVNPSTVTCTLILEITGGTGRFQNASGVLTYIELSAPVPGLVDAMGHPFLTTDTGEITGVISLPAGQEGLPAAAQ